MDASASKRSAWFGVVAAAAAAACGCGKPDPGRPDTGGPLVVVAAPDAGVDPAVDAGPVFEGSWCLEEWRVSLPPGARLLDMAWVSPQVALLVEADAMFFLVLVGGGGQASAGVLGDFLPAWRGDRSAWGSLSAGPDRILALYGWGGGGAGSGFVRAARRNGTLIPDEDSDTARRRFFSPEPAVEWELGGDPTAPSSRLWLVPFGESFFALGDLWKEDVLEAGRMQAVRKHQFAIFNAGGRRAAGFNLRGSRGAPPVAIGALAAAATTSDDRPWELFDQRGRRQSGALLAALKERADRVPLAGGCLTEDAADDPEMLRGDAGEADVGGDEGESADPGVCFALFAAPGGARDGGVPTLERLGTDGIWGEWPVPAELRATSTFEAVAGGMVWGAAPDGTVWAAGPDGRLRLRTRLPDGAVLRRYDARGVAAATVGREGTVRSVVQCIPGGSRPETAREVPLDGTLAAARSGAAARWNERAIDGIAALAAAAAGPRPVPAETLRRLYSYEVVRGMAARARTLDPELHVALLAAAALEMLAGDPAAARREFSATRGIEPPRRERLRLLACREAVLLPLRWDREIGMALGCPDVPPAWAAAPLDLPGAAAPVEIPLDDASADGGDGAADGGALEEPGPPTIPPFGGFDDVLPFGKPPPDDEGFDGPTDDLEAEGP